MRWLLGSYLVDRPVAGFAALLDLLPDFSQLFQEGRDVPLDGPRPPMVKTHFLPGVEVLRPYREATTKIVYLVRNPRDVLTSATRVLRVAERHRHAFAQAFIRTHGVEHWEQTGWGTWPQHVREWSAPQRHFPNAEVCVVRYEDLRNDTAAKLLEVVDFLGLDGAADPDRVQRAVEHSALGRLHAVERANDPGRSNTIFFGRGSSGQSLADYGDDVETAYRRLLATPGEFSACAEQFRYAT